MEVKVYKWVEVAGKKYGLVNKHKVDNVLHCCRKGQDSEYEFDKTDNPADDLILALYDKHGGLIVDEKIDRVETFTFWDVVNAKPKKVEKEKVEKKEEKPKAKAKK